MSLYGAMSNGQCEEIYSDLPGNSLFVSPARDGQQMTANDSDDGDGDDGDDDWTRNGEDHPITDRIYEKLNILRPSEGHRSDRRDDDQELTARGECLEERKCSSQQQQQQQQQMQLQLQQRNVSGYDKIWKLAFLRLVRVFVCACARVYARTCMGICPLLTHLLPSSCRLYLSL